MIFWRSMLLAKTVLKLYLYNSNIWSYWIRKEIVIEVIVNTRLYIQILNEVLHSNRFYWFATWGIRWNQWRYRRRGTQNKLKLWKTIIHWKYILLIIAPARYTFITMKYWPILLHLSVYLSAIKFTTILISEAQSIWESVSGTGGTTNWNGFPGRV